MLNRFILAALLSISACSVYADPNTSCDENKLNQAKALFRCETQYSGKECNSHNLAVLSAGMATLAVIPPEDLQKMKLIQDFHNDLIALRKKITLEHKQILDEYSKYLKKNKMAFKDGSTEIQLKDIEPILSDLLKKYPNNQMLKDLIAKSKLTSTDRPVAINDVIQSQFSELFERIQIKLGHGSKFKSISAMTLGEHVSYSLNDMKIAYAKKAYAHDQDIMSAKVERLQSENKTLKSEYQMTRTQLKTMAKYLARIGGVGAAGATVASHAAAGTVGDIAIATGQSFEKGAFLDCLNDYKIKISPETSSLLFQNLIGVQKLKSAKSEPICNRIIVNEKFIDYVLFDDSAENIQLREFVCRIYDNRVKTYDQTFTKPRPIIFDPKGEQKSQTDTIISCTKITTPLNSTSESIIEMDISDDKSQWSIESLKSNNGACRNWIDTHIKYNPTYRRHQKFQLFQPQFICEDIDQNECRKALCQLSRAALEQSQSSEVRKLQCAALQDMTSSKKDVNSNLPQKTVPKTAH